MKAKHILIFAALLLSLTIPIAASPAPINGVVSVTFPEGNIELYDTIPTRIAALEKELEELEDLQDKLEYELNRARQLQAATPYTGTSPSDPTIPLGGWAATEAAHSVFAAAIATAEGIMDDLEEHLEELEEELYALRNAPIVYYELYGLQLERGDTFSLTVSLTENTGFTGMPLRFTVPPGIESVSITPHHTDYFDYDARIIDGEFFMGWAGAVSNFTGTGDLVTIEFTVANNAALTQNAPITMAFAYAASYTMGVYEPAKYATPTNRAGAKLNFTLPGVPTATPARQVARITITP